MRRRRQGRGRTVTARELVAAVTAAGLDDASTDDVNTFLAELGNYNVVHWLRARCVIVAADHGNGMRPGYVWDDGRPGGNEVGDPPR